MSEDLISDVLTATEADSELSDDSSLYIYAALQGHDELAQVLEKPPDQKATRPEAQEPAVPVRAFLSAIQVEGFRGVGPKVRLPLAPGPGLTVICGRNGCGKSSFAEALEVALTSQSYRWSKRSQVWSESWRNLHQKQKAAIQIELAVEGQGVLSVGTSWTPEAALDDMTAWVQRRGEQRQPGLEALGWKQDLELFRPFLSYDELSAVVAEPSALYDKLSPILGLEQITDAIKRLKAAVKTCAEPKKAAADRLKALKPQLADLADERAQKAYALVRKQKPDLDAVRALATGTDTVDEQGTLATLERLVELRCPTIEGLATVRQRYLDAEKTLSELGTEASGANARRLALLAAALEIHEDDGDGPCPVCQSGQLDGAWAATVRQELDQDRALSQRLTAARGASSAASKDLASLAFPVPRVLRDADALPESVKEAVQQAFSAWSAWSDLRTPEQIVDAGVATLELLAAALEELRVQASQEIATRQDTWQPLALELSAWLTDAMRAQQVREKLDHLTKASDWLGQHEQSLREKRMQPLAQRTQEIWAQLRQESNVDIDNVVLSRSGLRRWVEFPASVDGEEAPGLSVMSQGELNALALSVFLPKATMDGSPFGFVVIDDPVQAMDPAKVDGLAKVLSQAAKDRQVVVLTHDDRLPEAVRRLALTATLLQVTRGTGSAVTIKEITDPALEQLADARAVASDNGVDEVVRSFVIPELCRMALEARCHDIYFTRCLRAGDARSDVEQTWAEAKTASARLGLAVELSPDNLSPWLAKAGHRNAALGICSSAVHKGLKGDPHMAIKQVERTLKDLESYRGH